MDSGDGGAEEDNGERQPGSSEQEEVAGESNMPLDSAKDRETTGSEHNDVADGNFSGAIQDKDGDLCVQGREASVSHSDENNGESSVLGSSRDGSGELLEVVHAEKPESPRPAEADEEVKSDPAAAQVLQSGEENKSSGDTEYKDSPESTRLQESKDVSEESHVLASAFCQSEELTVMRGGNDIERAGDDDSKTKEVEEGDGNVIEEKLSAFGDNVSDSNVEQVPNTEFSSKNMAEDSADVDEQKPCRTDENPCTLPTSEDSLGQDLEQKEGEGQPDNHNITPTVLGTELDDFFASSIGPGNFPDSATGDSSDSPKEGKGKTESAEGIQNGLFPALDNVDLETDEELLDGEKAEERAEKMTESAAVVEELREANESAANVGCDSKQQVGISPTQGGIAGDPGAKGPATHSPIFCQDNYKVCRELQPGIKECLILETGEQFICVNPPHEEHGMGPSGNEAEKPVYLVQSSKEFETQGGDTKVNSSPLVENDNATPQVYRTTHPTMLRIDHVLSPSEAFAYVSFGDDGSGDGYCSPSQKHSDGSLQSKFLNSMQQGYITRNGIPVIMDNSEEEIYTSNRSKSHDDLDLRGQKSRGSRYDQHPTSWKEDTVHKIPSNFSKDLYSANFLTSTDNERYRKVEDYSGEDFYLWERKSKYEGKRTRSTPEQSSDYSSSYRPRPASHSYSSHSHRYSPTRSSYLNDSSNYRTRDSSYLYRSGEHSSEDLSRLSTRFRHLDKGDAQSSASRHESSTVPRFNTLHDQQVSWLDMFKMIEAQHRTELRSQHEQHERLLQQMQQNMARELSKQQDTLKHSLSAHREILEELSPGRHRDSRQNKNQSRKFDDIEGSSMDSQRSAESPAEQSSHTTLQGVDVSLKNPPPFSRYSDIYDSKDPNDVPVKRSLESELSSPSRPADTSLSQSRISMGCDKQLRGGVYSSPMPIAKAKHKNSPRAHKSSSDGTVHSSPNDDKSRNAISVRKHPSDKRRDHLEQVLAASTDVSQADSEDFLSPRTRINLREKHARHLADLRAYYEEELRDMRQMLQASQRKLERSGGDGPGSTQSQAQGLSLQQPPGKSMEEKILSKENEELRQRCRELQDDYHDSKSEIRELQQKIQGLEIRAADYAERYDQSQAQVLSLGSRLEELTEFAKEKESSSSDLEAKNKRVAESLQMAYKKEKELTESLHSAKTTIQRLVDKYEMLEKDYTILKESAAANQEKLLQSRHEAIETNNKLSRLEMDNKQFQHDNEILKHELTMTRSSLSMRTSYEDSFSPSHSREQGKANHSASTSLRNRSRDRSQHNSSPNPVRKSKPRQTSPDDQPIGPTDESLRSPILRAEEELRRLQGSVGGAAGSRSSEFAPKLQRKFYGTEVPPHTRATPTNRNRSSFSPNSKTLSPLEKKGRSAPLNRDSVRGSRASTNTKQASKAEPLNYITERERSGKTGNLDKKSRDNFTDKDQNSSSKKPVSATNGMSGDIAMERIRSGDIVSRPDWEDMYTSMVPSRSSSNGIESSNNRAATREQILQERVQNIDNLEKKYDKLVTQKRKYESSLSKLPVHGHRGEKERLEAELDQLDKELGSVRMSLKRFHVLKSTI
ncbi:M-phase phosphoprotein 9 [Elysia marginata]|uniref:M-phase phosphoprotein 9 n=1 Tax=Elysia marginata TaxID=1093978 RepID=A0AAV4HK37_9GAST|nr:M-phase phosphoprotein 9 [Elysia marginata]